MLLAFVFFCCGCNKDNEATGEDSEYPSEAWFTYSTGNYMDSFMLPDTVFLVDRGLANGKQYFSVVFNYSVSGVLHSYTRAKSTRYTEYVKYYGDTTYAYRHDYSPTERGCLMPLNNISIVADRDYDEQHPAGTSLCDLVTIEYLALYSFIKNGYKTECEDERFRLDPADSISVLSDCKSISLFSDLNSSFCFDTPPDTPGKYTFTVTLNFGEDPLTGEKVELEPASITIEF
jgi:hypothetical protein